MPVTGDWVWKSDGAGASEVEAEKGMLSDAIAMESTRYPEDNYVAV